MTESEKFAERLYRKQMEKQRERREKRNRSEWHDVHPKSNPKEKSTYITLQPAEFYPPVVTLEGTEGAISSSASDLNTPVLTESQQEDIKRPRVTRHYLSYVKGQGNPSELQASADSYCIWSGERPGFAASGCSGCEEAKTCCDVCLFFLPKLTRIHLMRRYERSELRHMLAEDGTCVLCKQEGPNNQLCPDNVWSDEGDLLRYEKCDPVIAAVESRWEEMLKSGIVSQSDRCEIVDAQLYGRERAWESEKSKMQENTEIRKRSENLRQPKIKEAFGCVSGDGIKKDMVSVCMSIPPRTQKSADIESWFLRAAHEIELDAGETASIKSMLQIPHEIFSVPHVLRIEQLTNDHWLGPSVSSMLSVKTGVIRGGCQGSIRVSVYNKGAKSIVIRKGAVLGLIVRENYLNE